MNKYPLMFVIPDGVTFTLLVLACLGIIACVVYIIVQDRRLANANQRAADAEMKSAEKDIKVRALQTMNREGIISIEAYQPWDKGA
jgi:hypothetical protein